MHCKTKVYPAAFQGLSDAEGAETPESARIRTAIYNLDNPVDALEGTIICSRHLLSASLISQSVTKGTL